MTSFALIRKMSAPDAAWSLSRFVVSLAVFFVSVCQVLPKQSWICHFCPLLEFRTAPCLQCIHVVTRAFEGFS